MTDEPTPIIVPTALIRAYNAARVHGLRATAIHNMMDDCDVWNDLCEDCCKVMEAHKARNEGPGPAQDRLWIAANEVLEVWYERWNEFESRLVEVQ